MGKGNNPLKPRPLPPSFFMQQRQRNGEYWMNFVSTEFIRKNANRIFKDLATGAANVDYEYTNFLNYTFTYNLREAAAENAKYNYTSHLGICYSPVPVDNDMLRIANDQWEKCQVYNIIVYFMDCILNDVSYNKGLLCRYYLHELVANIRYKRNIFNGNYVTVTDEDNNKHCLNVERRIKNNDNGIDQDYSGVKGFFAKPNETHM